MKARPILFSAPMVRALLQGRKTQTRRIIKGHSFESHPYLADDWHLNCEWLECPYGKPGDLLWVRESWCETNRVGAIRRDLHYVPNWVEFKADCGIMRYPVGGNFATRESDFKWTPSIHMPRWASRLTLELTEVRVERLQDISEGDAEAEGTPQFAVEPGKDAARMPCRHCGATKHSHVGSANACSGGYGTVFNPSTSRGGYAFLWESINGTGSWDANPWVWVLTFRVHQQNIDDFIKSREAA